LGNVSLRDQKAYFQSHPPRLLAPFRFERIEHPDLGGGGGHGEPISVHFAVSCMCGTQDLTISAIHSTATMDVASRGGWAPSASGGMKPILLNCPACGAMHANTGGHMKCVKCGAIIAQDAAPPPHVPDYRVVDFHTSPLTCQCAACGRDEVLFDLGRHGYDAEIGYSAPTMEGEQKSLGTIQGERLVVSLYFPDDLLGPDAGFDRPEDHFTWIAFSRVGKAVAFLIEFECA